MLNRRYFADDCSPPDRTAHEIHTITRTIIDLHTIIDYRATSSNKSHQTSVQHWNFKYEPNRPVSGGS